MRISKFLLPLVNFLTTSGLTLLFIITIIIPFHLNIVKMDRTRLKMNLFYIVENGLKR